MKSQSLRHNNHQVHPHVIRLDPLAYEPGSQPLRPSIDSAIAYPMIPFRPPSTKLAKKTSALVKSERKTAKNLSFRLWQASALTAMILLFLVAGFSLNLSSRLQQTTQELQTQNTTLASLQVTNDQLATANQSLASWSQTVLSQNKQMQALQQSESQGITTLQAQLSKLTTAEQAFVLSDNNISNNNSSDDSYGMFYRSGQSGIVVAQGLQTLSNNQVYQVWSIDEQQQAKSLTIFSVESGEKQIWHEFSIPEALPSNVTIVITTEPAGGSQTPGNYLLKAQTFRE